MRRAGTRASRRLAVLLVAVAVAALLATAGAQLSQPIAQDANVDEGGNKFLQREARKDPSGTAREEADVLECPLNVALSWMTEVSASVYATPLITDLYSDGAKEIVVPSFVHYLEVLEASDGAAAPGWPAFHKSSTHTSPLLVDVDFDGVQDIALATYDGEVLFFKDNGEQLREKLVVPRLRVRRDWHVGLAVDHVDHSHPDVHDPEIGKEAALQSERVRQANEKAEKEARKAAAFEPVQTPPPELAEQQQQQEAQQQPPQEEEQQPQQQQQEAQQQQPPPQPAVPEQAQAQEQQPAPADGESQPQPVPAQADGGEAGAVPAEAQPAQDAGQGGEGAAAAAEIKPEGEVAGQAAAARRRLLVAEEEQEATVELDPKGEIDPEAADSFKVFEDEGEDDYDADEEEEHEEEENELHGADPYYEEHYEEEDYLPYEEHSRKHWRGHKPQEDDYDLEEPEFWEDEDFEEETHSNTREFVQVDAHILCTPSIADIDGDGHDEMVVVVSYFYDHEYYDEPAHAKELGEDVDISKYIASGVVAFQLSSRTLKWSQHLDLTTDVTKYRAYAYASPTLVDINRDGKMEIILGTSVGFLYALDHTGEPLEGWPVQMGEIQGQPLVADLNGDGYVEIFAADYRGNTALFNHRGRELWERHTGGSVTQGATAADVNGDGELEIVFGTSNGEIHVVSGKTGEELPLFPFVVGDGHVQSGVMAPILVTKLQDHTKAMHLVVVGFDGLLYMIDGITGCADTVDIGEVSYSMVLTDDLNGNGKMDLLVTTMNGNVYAFETSSDYHPLKVWGSQLQGRNNMLARHGYQGIFALPSSRAPRDVRGQTLSVRFEIVDNRPPVLMPSADAAGEPESMRGPYQVVVTLQGVGVDEMNMGDQPVIGMMDTFAKPGTYQIEIPCPRTRSTATVHIEMKDENQIMFTDDFSLSFHIHFYRLLKWLLLLPFTMMAAVVLAMKLPSATEGILPLAMTSRAHDA